MTEFNFIIVKPLQEAETLFFNHDDYHIRVVKENCERYYCSANIDTKRINVAIIGTTITQIFNIG